VQKEAKDTAITPERRVAKYLKVITGLKGAAMMMMVWGATYYFAWFSVVSNPNELQDMRKTYFFNIVSSTVYTVPLFFFCSGFLQTFAFMQRDQEESMFTSWNLAKYYFRKIFRYMPLNITAMLVAVHGLPYLGSGPIWNYFAELVKPCSSLWWTNMFWLNNLHPAEYNDKCLPWTWFVPTYVQLSLLLPPILAVYKSVSNKMAVGVGFAVLYILSIIWNFALVYSVNHGATIIAYEKELINEEYYAKVFMSPVYHFGSFFLGICLGLIYLGYRQERADENALNNSMASRLIEMLRHNSTPRYCVYLCAILLITASVLW